jgi:ssDNA thymidine ADP-ribosyltransferase DarT-like protein
MGMHFYRDSGFAATGGRPPRIDAPSDWLAWHFTTWANLTRIVQTGCLRADRAAQPPEAVGDQAIKQNRLMRPVILDKPDYPSTVTVGDHVPFYFTPRSPMLRRVLGGGAPYQGDHTGLVMLGIGLRTVVECGLTWCVSDCNAASPVVRFTCDLGSIGTFIDFPLMTEFMYRKTDDDPHRPTRRGAELLILDHVPVELITHIVTSTANGRTRAREVLQTVGGTRHYEVQPCFLYQ